MEKLSLSGKSSHSTDDAMRGLSAVFVDGERVFIDNGAIHAKSNVERGIQFTRTKEEVKNPREIWVFWITLKRDETKQQGYHGAMPFPIYIDDEAKLGYKSLSEQVNKMDKAIKGQIDVSQVPLDVLEKTVAFLKQVRVDLWEHAKPEFQAAFTTQGVED